MKFCLLLFFIFGGFYCQAESLDQTNILDQSPALDRPIVYVITALSSDTQITVSSSQPNPQIGNGSIFSLYSHETDAVIGYATVTVTDNSKRLNQDWLATITTHSKSELIRPGNYARPLNLFQKSRDIPGRYDLQITGRKEISARYKPLVYLGYLAGNASAVLAKKEYILGPGIFGYGLTDRFQAEVIPLLAFTKIGTIAGKYNIFRNDEYSLSVLYRQFHFFEQHKGARDIVVYLDTYANSRFVSYLKLTFESRRPARMPFVTSPDFDRNTSEIQSTQGIVLNNWDKIVLGTKYNFVEKNIGGHLGYMFIGDHLHFLVGLESSNFRKLRYGKNGYALYADIFARW